MSENQPPKIIGILKTPNDPRVCLLPKEVKRLTTELKYQVQFEPDFGSALGIEDSQYIEAGARSMAREQILKTSDIIISVNHTFNGEELKEGALFIGIFNPLFHSSKLDIYQQHSASVYSLDMLPRTTLAQSMDVLSSMASLAGYRAVIKSAALFNGIFPMFTTAAGTLTPAKVLILGAGVAGLQAIATARRLIPTRPIPASPGAPIVSSRSSQGRRSPWSPILPGTGSRRPSTASSSVPSRTAPHSRPISSPAAST